MLEKSLLIFCLLSLGSLLYFVEPNLVLLSYHLGSICLKLIRKGIVLIQLCGTSCRVELVVYFVQISSQLVQQQSYFSIPTFCSVVQRCLAILI